MFEYEGTFYNPRYVVNIHKVQAPPHGGGLFEVTWHGGEVTVFIFRSPAEADEQRYVLAHQVNKCNGG